MKCSNCGHDLMLGLAPEGLGRLLPITTYTCVRCGHANRRLSETWSGRGPLLAIVIALIFGVGAAAWFGLIGPGVRSHSVRRGVVTTVQTPPPPAPPVVTQAPDASAPADTATSNDSNKPDAPKAAANGETAPADTAADDTPAPAEGTAAQASTSTAPEPSRTADAETTQDTRPAAMPAPKPTAPGQPPVVASRPAPASKPAPAATANTAAQPKTRPAESDLDEVQVASPPSSARPKVEAKGAGTNKAAGWNARLTALRVDDWKDARIVTLAVKGVAGDPKGFQLSSPPRYVVDVPGQWSSQVAKSTPVNQGAIRTVRLGLYPDKLRIVIDLASEPKQATVRRTKEGLVVTVR